MWLDFNKQNTQNFHPSRTGCKRSKEGKIKHMWDIICFFLYKLMYQIIETIGKSWIVESMLVKCKRKDWDLLFVCMPIFFQHSIHICIYIYIWIWFNGLRFGKLRFGKNVGEYEKLRRFSSWIFVNQNKQKGSLQNSKVKGQLGVKKDMEVKCKRTCTVWCLLSHQLSNGTQCRITLAIKN